jgi:hypothetical protein
MRLDVLIPVLNRAALLERAPRLLAARQVSCARRRHRDRVGESRRHAPRDEEVDKGRSRAINDAFRDESIGFIGGPYVAVRQTPPPGCTPGAETFRMSFAIQTLARFFADSSPRQPQ